MFMQSILNAERPRQLIIQSVVILRVGFLVMEIVGRAGHELNPHLDFISTCSAFVY
jgi:hypothetical protein